MYEDVLGNPTFVKEKLSKYIRVVVYCTIIPNCITFINSIVSYVNTVKVLSFVLCDKGLSHNNEIRYLLS